MGEANEGVPAVWTLIAACATAYSRTGSQKEDAGGTKNKGSRPKKKAKSPILPLAEGGAAVEEVPASQQFDLACSMSLAKRIDELLLSGGLLGVVEEVGDEIDDHAIPLITRGLQADQLTSRHLYEPALDEQSRYVPTGPDPEKCRGDAAGDEHPAGEAALAAQRGVERFLNAHLMRQQFTASDKMRRMRGFDPWPYPPEGKTEKR
ncbi:MAG: hypothetical protein QM783_13865 [Phycisphaerales bacterium]